MRLIAGSGRSGTTWVLDTLASANSLRPVFEPLHPYISDVGNRFAHRALGPGDEAADLSHYLQQVCAGHGNSLWVKYRQQLRWLLPPPAEFSTKNDAGRIWRNWSRLLRDTPKLAIASLRRESIMKCIRMNLMLGWLTRQLGCRAVLVVRHPGAVIESELRGGWSAKFALERYRSDAMLEQLTEGRYRKLLNRDLSPIEALTVRWIIENDWVIESAEVNGFTVVHYERLRDNPHFEWERVCTALNLPIRPSADLISRPSQQSSRNNSDATQSAHNNPRWLRVLTAGQKNCIQALLDAVELSVYSMSEPGPRRAFAASGTSDKTDPTK